MRYKVIGYIEADEDMGWDAAGLRNELEEAIDYGDVSRTFYVLPEPVGCDVHPLVSRMCEMGTNCCITPHTQCRWCRGKGWREFDRGEEVRGCADCKGTGRAQ